AAFVFAVIAYISGRADFSRYLNILYLPGAGELTIFCVALVGAALGFLWFNSRPAEVFMGDTGSLAMGAAIGGIAVLLKKEFLLPFAAAIFIIESVSVILQVQYFRFTKRKYGKGKRLFLMAPLHHHYELKGWAESKVVVRFWILGILFALMTLSTFKIR
ncbi:MAG TPA: phospho-N-acetylmuramoyl-pentapeptide-transferase, partial [Candidatus Marinimicrobia bacterium]|nr:phospho-N-acetylmuramoyl-pentapeptide-transferase [Candidatus Neomarinimicrobiota bacterium]